MKDTHLKVEFTQEQFQKAVEVGGFSKVVVRAGWSHFAIFGQTRGGGEAFLVSTRQKRAARQFRSPAAALVLLRQMGATKVEIEMGEWDLEMTAVSMRMRPDVTARRLRERRILEAAYYPGIKVETGEVGRAGEMKLLAEKKVRFPKGNW